MYSMGKSAMFFKLFVCIFAFGVFVRGADPETNATDAAVTPEANATDAAVTPEANATDAAVTPEADTLVSNETMMFDPSIVCPLNLTSDDEDSKKMAEYLDGLVTACTANETTSATNETNLAFCGACVRPLQTFLAREFHLADLMRDATEEWDSSNTDIHQKCASDVTSYLESKGMPYNDDFHNAVYGCKDFADDPTCTIATEKLVAMPAIAEALEKCQANNTVDDVMASGSEVMTGNATSASAKHPFCEDCYWPFFEAMVKTTMSEDFMCKLKTESDTMSDQEVEKELLQDPHMFACLLNVEGYLRQNNMKSASIGFTDMEAICLDDINRPADVDVDTPAIKSWMVHDDMKEVLDALVCPTP